MKKKLKWRDIFWLQVIVMIYSFSSIAAKFASGQAFMTAGFILFYGLEVMILGIYAILWQQVIKKVDISIAYANRAMVFLWGLLWGVLIFHDRVTVNKIVGILLVIVGVVIVNRGEEREEKE